MAKDNKGNKYYSLVVPNPDPENPAEDQLREDRYDNSYDQVFGPMGLSDDREARLKQIAEGTEAIKLFNISRDHEIEKKKRDFDEALKARSSKRYERVEEDDQNSTTHDSYVSSNPLNPHSSVIQSTIPMDGPLSFSLGLLQSPIEMGSQNSDEDELLATKRLSKEDLEKRDRENLFNDGDTVSHDFDRELLHKRLQDQGPLTKKSTTSIELLPVVPGVDNSSSVPLGDIGNIGDASVVLVSSSDSIGRSQQVGSKSERPSVFPFGFFRMSNLFSSGKGDKYQQVQDYPAKVQLANPLNPSRSVINSDQNPGNKINPLERLELNQSYKGFPEKPLPSSIPRLITKKSLPDPADSYVTDKFSSIFNRLGAVLGIGKNKSRINPVEVKSEDVKTTGEVEGSIVSSESLPKELGVNPDPFKLEIKNLSEKNKIAEINRILDVPTKSIGVVTVKKAIEEVEGKQEASHAGSIKDTKYRNAALDILRKTFQELNSSVVKEDERITGSDVAIFVFMMQDFVDKKIKGNPNEVGENVGFKAWRDEIKTILDDNPNVQSKIRKIPGVGEAYELNSEKLISKFANISKTIQEQAGKYYDTVQGRKYVDANLGARSFRIVQLLPDPFEVDLASLVDKAGSVKSR